MASISDKWLGRNPTLTQVTSAHVLVEGILLYAACFILLSTLIFSSPGFLGNDDYYHARMGGEIARQGQLAVDFPWLPKTILSSDRFVDHHLLYHIYLAPWVHLYGVTGAKLAQVAIAAGVFLGAWWVLRQVKVCWPMLWTLALFAVSSPFLYRMLMIRTQGASLLLLLIALNILFKRRYRWLLPLSFAYVWLYNGFILLLALAAFHAVGMWLAERRLNWQPIIYCAVGILLGLLINPYFPRNVIFTIEHLSAKVDLESGVSVGSEWYPYSTGVLLANSGGSLLVLVLGFLRSSVTGLRRDNVENTLLFASLLLLVMVFRSRRFIEYYPLFALLFCAVTWGREPVRMFEKIPRAVTLLFCGGVILFVALGAGDVLAQTRETIENAEDPRQFSGASNWLQANSPEGALIFQTDWDDFTRLFYYNTSNRYLVGLDPTYLERADRTLWDQWVALTRGEIENPSSAIRTLFDTEYVVSDGEHQAFIDQANADPDMHLVYWDRDSFVWQIR